MIVSRVWGEEKIELLLNGTEFDSYKVKGEVGGLLVGMVVRYECVQVTEL